MIIYCSCCSYFRIVGYLETYISFQIFIAVYVFFLETEIDISKNQKKKIDSDCRLLDKGNHSFVLQTIPQFRSYQKCHQLDFPLSLTQFLHYLKYSLIMCIKGMGITFQSFFFQFGKQNSRHLLQMEGNQETIWNGYFFLHSKLAFEVSSIQMIFEKKNQMRSLFDIPQTH